MNVELTALLPAVISLTTAAQRSHLGMAHKKSEETGPKGCPTYSYNAASWCQLSKSHDGRHHYKDRTVKKKKGKN